MRTAGSARRSPRYLRPISQGRALREAKSNVTEALELAVEWRRDEGQALPEPVEVTVNPVTVAGS
ncbi:MAG TPA: hypothetical protein VES62_03730 [Thermoleophilaceae bacterium]|nr:hypothetical protein [Thermoleophilaceae bacterium]